MAGRSLLVRIGIVVVVVVVLLEVAVAQQLKGCGGTCKSNDECQGQLACMSGKCADDPDVGTHICSGGNSSPSSSCKPSGSKTIPGDQSCNEENDSECCKAGVSYPQYTCSPQISGSTAAQLTLNGFDANEDGGGPAKCGEHYYKNTELIVALSTGWFNKVGCYANIKISASNGRSVVAKVVDQCDSVYGCDEEHSYQPPCRNNIVDGSAAVWKALGLNEEDGNSMVKWTLA